MDPTVKDDLERVDRSVKDFAKYHVRLAADALDDKLLEAVGRIIGVAKEIDAYTDSLFGSAENLPPGRFILTLVVDEAKKDEIEKALNDLKILSGMAFGIGRNLEVRVSLKQVKRF